MVMDRLEEAAMSIGKYNINTKERYWHSDVIAGDFIFTSYQAGVEDDEGKLIETVEGQTEQAIRNLARVLEQAGADLADVVKVTLLVRSHEEFRDAMKAYGRHFAEHCPARTTIITAFLGDAILVQLDAIAYKPGARVRNVD
jgi:2-iminobutanoate/2-iminopropanoate deaminase